MNVQPYWNEDHTKYAVLVARGYGAGFSTWSDYSEIAYDGRIIEWFLAHDIAYMQKLHEYHENEEQREALQFFKSIGYNQYICFLGLESCEIKWVPAGALWRMTEYDGAEGIEYQDKQDWRCF